MKKVIGLLVAFWICLPASAEAQKVLWSQEEPLPLLTSRSAGSPALQIKVDPSAIDNFEVGESISLLLESGVTKLGVISKIDTIDSGQGTRIIGSLQSENGSSFSLEINDNQISGFILLRADDVGYEVSVSPLGAKIEKHNYGMFVCDDMPFPQVSLSRNVLERSESRESSYATSVSSVPLFSSKPDAVHVLYLDFDGETVIDSMWNTSYNEGEPIVALPYDSDGDNSLFSTEEVEYIREVWQGTVDAYAIFEVNVTTDRNVFDSTPVSQRQMAIITPTYQWLGGFQGGRAIRNSFGVDNRPVFGFPNGLLTQSKWMAMAISHELGHSFGLFHDGLNGQQYHPGQGTSVSDAYGWGPIMGAAYSASYLTWSNGDYSGSTNTEDDLAIINEELPFKNDLVANTNAGATSLGASSLLRTIGYNDTDVYQVYAENGQRISASVTVEGLYPKLNSQLSLYTENGQLVSQNSPPPTIPDQISTQNSAISYRVIQAGTYFLHVAGAGFDGGPGYGHSTYGAVGNYNILASIIPAPVRNEDAVVTPILELLLLDDEIN